MTVPGPPPPQGRDRQRRRTARAIVEAAGALLAEGRTPTIGEIADAAEVSRRTVHAHFATLEQLLTAAVLGRMSDEVMEEALAASRVGDDPEERIAALARGIVRHHDAVEHLGRTMIRLTIDRGEGERTPLRRGHRRLDWIETAIEPARARLSPAAYDRLVTGLAMVIGWEAMLVLWDVRGLSLEEAEEATVWSARALVRVALQDAAGGDG